MPGTSSISRWPFAKSAMRANLTVSDLPRMTLSIAACSSAIFAAGSKRHDVSISRLAVSVVIQSLIKVCRGGWTSVDAFLIYIR